MTVTAGSTTKLALPYPGTASNNDTPQYILNLANAIVTALAGSGTLASRPVATIQDQRYYATDIAREYRSFDGSTWTPIGSPPGEIHDFHRSTVPTGYLLCDGSTITGGQTLYPDLWAVLPAANKSGSNIILPDQRGRMRMGLDNLGSAAGAANRYTGFNTVGGTSGANSITLSGSQLPAHSHDMTHSHAVTDPGHLHENNVAFTFVGLNTTYAAVGAGADVRAVKANGGSVGGAQTDVSSYGAVTSISVASLNGSTGNGPGTGAAVTIVPNVIGVLPCIRV